MCTRRITLTLSQQMWQIEMELFVGGFLFLFRNCPLFPKQRHSRCTFSIIICMQIEYHHHRGSSIHMDEVVTNPNLKLIQRVSELWSEFAIMNRKHIVLPRGGISTPPLLVSALKSNHIVGLYRQSKHVLVVSFYFLLEHIRKSRKISRQTEVEEEEPYKS